MRGCHKRWCATPDARLRTASGQRRGQLHRAINDLDTLLERTKRVVAQTRSRLAGVMPDSASRIVSFHDVDARPIRKGRLGKPVEFGYKAQVVDNADGSSSTTPSRSETLRMHRNWRRRSHVITEPYRSCAHSGDR